MAGQAQRLKSIVGGSAGNLVEWFDFYCYAALTIYFAPLFFPEGDSTAQLLSAAAIFAVGFLMRPIGAWIMGIYGDRHGRKAGLALSVGLMCGGSLLIAIAPTHAQAGALAPIILVVARMMQGLSVGGEYGASATYLSEMATQKNRGFWSSFQYVTLIGGQLLAQSVLLILQFVMDERDLHDWGWRIPFALGAVLAISVYLLRRRLSETPSFQAMDKSGAPRSSFGALWREHPRAFLLIVAITAGGSLSFYAYSTYLPKFLVNTAGFEKQTATQISALALLVFMCAQPVWGWISDRIGRKIPLLFFAGAGMLVTVPVFSTLADTRSAPMALGLMLVPLLITAAYTSIGAVVKAEMFPVHIRTLGVALPYAIGNAIFGGSAEYVALWFKQQGMESGFYWYVTIMLGVAGIAFLIMPDTRKTSLIAED